MLDYGSYVYLVESSKAPQPRSQVKSLFFQISVSCSTSRLLDNLDSGGLVWCPVDFQSKCLNPKTLERVEAEGCRFTVMAGCCIFG